MVKTVRWIVAKSKKVWQLINHPPNTINNDFECH